MKKIKVSDLQDNIIDGILLCNYLSCLNNCIFHNNRTGRCVGLSTDYDFNSIKKHKFNKEEISIHSLRKFKLK